MKRLPIPRYDEPYLCPCFELIIGAAYGLQSAEQFGIRSRDLSRYHDDVRIHLPLLFGAVATVDRSNPAFVTWVNGFYFNSAIQRLTWAGDRLMAIFGCLATNCCAGCPQTQPVGFKPRLKWGQILDKVNARLAHTCFQGAEPLRRYARLLQPAPRFDAARDDVTEGNFLCAIRYDVNESKHSIGGFIRRSAGKGDTGPWARLGQDKQFEYAVLALEALVEVYGGMNELYFVRQLFSNAA